MTTASILTALVIAVLMYSLMKVSSECSRIEEEESIEWARKWNEEHTCTGKCEECTECNYHSSFKEV